MPKDAKRWRPKQAASTVNSALAGRCRLGRPHTPATQKSRLEPRAWERGVGPEKSPRLPPGQWGGGAHVACSTSPSPHSPISIASPVVVAACAGAFYCPSRAAKLWSFSGLIFSKALNSGGILLSSPWATPHPQHLTSGWYVCCIISVLRMHQMMTGLVALLLCFRFTIW